MSEINQILKHSSLKMVMMGIPSSCECGPHPTSSPNLVLPPGPGHLGSWHRLQARLRLVSVLRTSSPTGINSQPSLQKTHDFPKASFGAGLAREDLRIARPHGGRSNSERSSSGCSGTTPLLNLSLGWFKL